MSRAYVQLQGDKRSSPRGMRENTLQTWHWTWLRSALFPEHMPGTGPAFRTHTLELFCFQNWNCRHCVTFWSLGCMILLSNLYLWIIKQEIKIFSMALHGVAPQWNLLCPKSSSLKLYRKHEIYSEWLWLSQLQLHGKINALSLEACHIVSEKEREHDISVLFTLWFKGKTKPRSCDLTAAVKI